MNKNEVTLALLKVPAKKKRQEQNLMQLEEMKKSIDGTLWKIKFNNSHSLANIHQLPDHNQFEKYHFSIIL